MSSPRNRRWITEVAYPPILGSAGRHSASRSKRFRKLSVSITGLLVSACFGCANPSTCQPNQAYPTYPGYPQPYTLPSGTTVPTVGAPMAGAPMPAGAQMPAGQYGVPYGAPPTGQPPVYGTPINQAPPNYPYPPGQTIPPGMAPPPIR